jgi:alkylhydroperoxidase family enzyme
MSGDEVRALVPDALAAHELTRATVLEAGIVDRELKALCERSLAGEDVEPRDERERAALDWAYAVAWDADTADEALWARLHAHFSEPELVELGYAIAYMLGQQHWIRTLKGAG